MDGTAGGIAVATRNLNHEAVDDVALKTLIRSHYGWLQYPFPFVRRNKALRAKAKKQILKNVDLSVGKGRFTAIMGPSGAGKTTLINALVPVYW